MLVITLVTMTALVGGNDDAGQLKCTVPPDDEPKTCSTDEIYCLTNEYEDKSLLHHGCMKAAKCKLAGCCTWVRHDGKTIKTVCKDPSKSGTEPATAADFKK